MWETCSPRPAELIWTTESGEGDGRIKLQIYILKKRKRERERERKSPEKKEKSCGCRALGGSGGIRKRVEFRTSNLREFNLRLYKEGLKPRLEHIIIFILIPLEFILTYIYIRILTKTTRVCILSPLKIVPHESLYFLFSAVSLNMKLLMLHWIDVSRRNQWAADRKWHGIERWTNFLQIII